MANATGAVLRPTREEILPLFKHAGRPRISLYLPVDPRFPGRGQIPKRLEQQSGEALRRLREELGDSDAAAAIEGRLRELHSAAEAVASPARGLAALVTRERASAFGLLESVPESVSVGLEFKVLPLLEDLLTNRRYRVLCISAGRVALYEGDAWGLAEAQSSLPASLAEALGSEIEARGVQFHSSGRGGVAPIFHGQGGARDERQVDFQRFYHVLARELSGLDGGTPVVLATDGTHEGELRRVLTIERLLPRGYSGNPSELTPVELHERTWPIVEEQDLGRAREAAAEDFQRARGHGKALDETQAVVQAALHGRVRRLWVARDTPIPGRVDESQATIEQGLGTDDLRDSLAALVFARGGDVHSVSRSEMPSTAPIAAELR